MHFWALQLLIHYSSFLSLIGYSMATYIVDDADSSIRYSVGVWNPDGVNDTYISRDKCFDNTYTAAQRVSASDDAFLDIPLTGTSISLFVVTLPTCQVNASITVDNEAPTTHSFSQTKTTYNVQLYSSGPLPFGNHSVHVDLLSIVNGVDNTSCLFFDYAVINDALDGASCSVTSNAGSPTCTPVDQQPSNTGLSGGSLGGIIGGVLGFFVLVFCIASHWMHLTLQKQQGIDGTKLPLHVSSIGSQSSRMPDQVQQPDIRVGARSTESNVTIIIPRH